jgi:hypothetical protein
MAACARQGCSAGGLVFSMVFNVFRISIWNISGYLCLAYALNSTTVTDINSIQNRIHCRSRVIYYASFWNYTSWPVLGFYYAICWPPFHRTFEKTVYFSTPSALIGSANRHVYTYLSHTKYLFDFYVCSSNCHWSICDKLKKVDTTRCKTAQV